MTPKTKYLCSWSFPDIPRPPVGAPVNDGEGTIIGRVESVGVDGVVIEINTEDISPRVGFPTLPGPYGWGSFSMSAYFKEKKDGGR